MWKAEKIELIKNSEIAHKENYYFTDCYSLKINGVQIYNCIDEKLTIHTPDEFQDYVCAYCGISCDAGGFLCIKRHKKSLLFIPCFDSIDSFLQRDGCDVDKNYGEWYCPPQKWYEDGILEVDETMLPKFLVVLSGFEMQEIPFITHEEITKVLEWEKLVKEKPTVGFMRLDKI